MNYGKVIRLAYDGKVYNVSGSEKSNFVLVNGYNEKLQPTDIRYGDTDSEFDIVFPDFNNFVGMGMLHCYGCDAMGSPDIPFDAFSISIGLKNLAPLVSVSENIETVLSSTGEVDLSFDGKSYTDENLTISITAYGLIEESTFRKRYESENVIITVAMSGQYCDSNGVPI